MSSENDAERSVQNLEHDEDIRNQTSQDGSSDGEGGERSAREKLKKTSIAGLAQQSSRSKAADGGAHPLSESVNAESTPDAQVETGSRGRPSKKRSFEDLQTEDPGAGVENGGPPLPKKGLHKRMRSREVSGDAPVQGLEKREDVASPVQEESDVDARQSPGGPGVLVAAPRDQEEGSKASAAGTGPEDENIAADAKPDASNTVKPAATSEEQPSKTQVPASSGFANASTASPFSSFKSPKLPGKETETISSTAKTTSTSAFASSGLSAFASSEKSPFGSVGSTAKTSGGFGGVGGQSGFGSSSASLGPSPFATKPVSGFGSGSGFGSASGFGGGSSAFGAPKPFGSGLSSFAGPAGGASSFGKPKPFGTSTRDDEEEEGSENGDDDDDKEKSEESAQQDPRFKQQECKFCFSNVCIETDHATVETGEEGEQTVVQCRAKLYHFDKEWKERGAGVFKINVRYESKAIGNKDNKTNADTREDDDDDEDKDDDVEAGGQPRFSSVERKARLIMRTDGVHRVVLNTPVFKDMKVGTQDGQEPSGKTMLITGLEEGKPSLFQIKVSLQSSALRRQSCMLTCFFLTGRKGRCLEGDLPQDPRTAGRLVDVLLGGVSLASLSLGDWCISEIVVTAEKDGWA